MFCGFFFYSFSKLTLENFPRQNFGAEKASQKKSLQQGRLVSSDILQPLGALVLLQVGLYFGALFIPCVWF